MAGLEAAAGVAAGGGRVLVVDGQGESIRPRWHSTHPPHYADRRRHLGLGGRSLAWHGVTIRLEDWALDEWPAPIAGALRDEWYPSVEHDLAGWAGCPLDTPREADTELRNRLVARTGIEQWQLVPRAVRREAGRWRAYTPLDRWRDGPHPPDLLVAGSVVEVLADSDRVTGVRLENGTAVSAPRVLLAAGTLETTRLVAQARGVPGQAYRLADHLVEGFLVRLPSGTLPADGLARWPADATGRSTVFARTQRAGTEVLLDVWTMGEQLPATASTVRYPARGNAPWLPTVEPTVSAADDAVLADGRHRMGLLWSCLGLGPGSHPGPGSGPGSGSGSGPDWPSVRHADRSFEQAVTLSTAGAREHPVPYTWPLGSVDHEGSTLPYGDELDEGGRVAELTGLWVTGPAAFARPGAANPSLTTLALARRSARSLLQE